MGYDGETTPMLDILAEDGLVFKNAIAPGTKTPDSLPAMHTGRYPIATGPISNMVDARALIQKHMNTRFTLAECLSQQGYSTAAFTPNPWTSRYFGFDKGFDRFVDFFDEDKGSLIFKQILEGKGSNWKNAARVILSYIQRENTFKPWGSFYSDVIRWIEGQEQPYFLWVFLMDPHFPYLPDGTTSTQTRWANLHSNLQLYLQDQSSEYSEKTHKRLLRGYDDAIRYTDKFFQRLTSDLGSATEIIVTADHGEGFGEHGTYGHHNQLFEENVHVPLIIHGNELEGSINEPVVLTQLPEIITKIAEQDNSSIMNIGKEFVSINQNKHLAGLRGESWKYIHNKDNNSNLFFNLENDPEEQVNRFDDLKDKEAFRKAMKLYRDKIESESEIKENVADAMANQVGRL